MAIYIVLAVIATLGIILWAAWYYEKKRSEDLATVAEALNFSFQRKGDLNSITDYENFNLFSRGHSKKVSNILKGNSGDMAITVVDYQYTTGSGRNSTTHSQTLAGIKSDRLNLPAFTLCPENFLHKLGGIFGYKDIDFDTYPEFSKKYLLRGTDEDAVRATFSDELLSFYEKNKAATTEAEGNKFIYYKASGRISPREIRKFIQEGINLYGHLKKQVPGLN